MLHIEDTVTLVLVILGSESSGANPVDVLPPSGAKKQKQNKTYFGDQNETLSCEIIINSPKRGCRASM